MAGCSGTRFEPVVVFTPISLGQSCGVAIPIILSRILVTHDAVAFNLPVGPASTCPVGPASSRMFAATDGMDPALAFGALTIASNALSARVPL